MIINDAVFEKSFGKMWLSLSLDSLNGVDAFLDNFKPGEYEIKRKQTKRSLNANAFMWKLCDEIAFALKGTNTKDDVYRNAVRNCGYYYSWEMPEEKAKSLCKEWSKNGVAWVADIVDYADDPSKRIVHAYPGSSTYDKKQMNTLINYLLEDARAMNLEIAKDERIESLLVDWEPCYE